MKIENIKISELKEYPHNNKKHPEEQIDKIAKSIKDFGFRTPILVDKNNLIISGHGRYLAAKKLNIDEIPSIKIEDLSDNQIKLLRIADNKVSESNFDLKMLRLEFEELEGLDCDLNQTGFDFDEIASIMNEKTKNREINQEVKNLGEIVIQCPKCKHKFQRME